jgi:hypothetical protein
MFVLIFTLLILIRFIIIHVSNVLSFILVYLSYNLRYWFHCWSRVSSGSIVSDYGMDDRAIGVRSPAEAKDFSSSLCVQTGSGAHPASCTMGTGGPFPGGKARPGRDADHSPPSSAEVVNEYKLYLLSPQAHPWRVAGLLKKIKFAN